MADTYTVERSKVISAPPGQIYRHIIDFKEWADWSPWEAMDPDMEKTFSGADSGVGAKYAWSGNRKVGVGNMEITDAKDSEAIEIALEFVKPFKATNTTRFTLQPVDSGTHVQWSMTSRHTLLTRIMGVFRSMDSMIGPDFEKGLDQLKAVSEA